MVVQFRAEPVGDATKFPGGFSSGGIIPNLVNKPNSWEGLGLSSPTDHSWRSRQEFFIFLNHIDAHPHMPLSFRESLLGCLLSAHGGYFPLCTNPCSWCVHVCLCVCGGGRAHFLIFLNEVYHSVHLMCCISGAAVACFSELHGYGKHWIRSYFCSIRRQSSYAWCICRNSSAQVIVLPPS